MKLSRSSAPGKKLNQYSVLVKTLPRIPHKLAIRRHHQVFGRSAHRVLYILRPGPGRERDTDEDSATQREEKGVNLGFQSILQFRFHSQFQFSFKFQGDNAWDRNFVSKYFDENRALLLTFQRLSFVDTSQIRNHVAI